MNSQAAAAMRLCEKFALLASMIERHPEWLWLRHPYRTVPNIDCRSTPEHFSNCLFGNLESLGQFGRLLAAGLSHVGPPASTAADCCSYWPNPFSRAQLASLQILANSRDERNFIVALPAPEQYGRR
jgi:hypothetical protein